MMTKNLNYKIVSVIAAILLWIYVVATVNPTIEREYKNIPIIYKNLDYIYSNDLDIVGEKYANVSVKLSGKTNDFINVTEADIRAEVDLKNFDEDADSIQINFYVPNNLRLVDKSISEVPIKIEKVISKEIKVEIKQEGTPSDNLAVLLGSVIPESVVVEGASSKVDQAAKAIALQNMEEITSNTTRNVPITIVDSNDEEIVGLKLSQNFVNVSFETYKVVNLPIKFVTTGELDKDISVVDFELSQTEVGLLLPPDSKIDNKEIEIKPFDLSQVKESGKYNFELHLPEGSMLREKDKEFTVDYNVVKSKVKTVELNPKVVEIRNSVHQNNSLDEEYESSILIEYSGPDKQIDELKEENIKIFVDAEGLASGKHYLELQVEEINGLRINRIVPNRIGVKLQDWYLNIY